ncbi:hypothetical protein R4Z10_09250 [Niallia sp. XMNu-256]|uniref:hypothetical protein n=1 Tax=Niallia sp. XMNu-256 TaxID=3082444 RepID=UPI0030D4F403
MKNKTRIIIALIGSFLVFAIGMFRMLTESLSQAPMFVAHVFAITGFIGIVANGIMLRKAQSN